MDRTNKQSYPHPGIGGFRNTQTARVQEDCLRTWHATVVKTMINNLGRSRNYEVTLEDDGSWRGIVGFEDPEPLFERLATGDRVTATSWRRDIVVLGTGGIEQNTDDAPRDSLQLNAALGTLAGLFAAQAFVFGAVRVVRPSSSRPFTWNPYGGWMPATDPVAGIGVGITAMWMGIPWWFVPPAVPVVACLLAWAAGVTYPRRRRRPASRV
jgi:hypothetical protein